MTTRGMQRSTQRVLLNKLFKAILEELYVKQHLTFREIAKRTGIQRCTLLQRTHRLGLYPRDMQPEDIKAILERVGSVEKLAELTVTSVPLAKCWLDGDAAPSGEHLKMLRALKRKLARRVEHRE